MPGRKFDNNCETATVFNKRFWGFVITPVFTFLFFIILMNIFEEIYLPIMMIIILLGEVIGIFITPFSYTFSEKNVIIKYFWGPKETIYWENIKSVITSYEEPTENTHLDSYEIIYYSKRKRMFFMHGTIAKNKKTTHYLKKYYPNLK
ncbi:MAG: hypothetical protein IJ025_06255 [Clostridia bacterium]|nr:hypothetical protein [Clostridia bacterium]